MRAVIDTSFWIDYSRGRVTTAERESVERLWRFGAGVLYQFVWLELVVGYRSLKEQKALRDYRAISLWDPIRPEDAVKVEHFATTLRAKGCCLTASDLLIMAAADRLGAKIIHHDGDFTSALAYQEFAHLRMPAEA
jgi:predicted nucleic acid-binding protein